jgi:hypothetical protein
MDHPVTTTLDDLRPFWGMRPLSGVLEQAQIIRANRAASLEEDAGDHLYSIREDSTIEQHEITRWTPKTVYYAKPGHWYWAREWLPATRPDGTTGQELRYTGERKWSQPEDGRVSRVLLERDGEVCRCMYGNSKYCSEGFGGKPIPAGHILYASRNAALAVAAGDVKDLRRQMADAHPDRGGTSEGFIAARSRYLKAAQPA